MSNEQTVINMLKKLEQDIAQIKQDQVTEVCSCAVWMRSLQKTKKLKN